MQLCISFEIHLYLKCSSISQLILVSLNVTFANTLLEQGPRLNVKTVFPRYEDFPVNDRLIVNMGIPILVRRHLRRPEEHLSSNNIGRTLNCLNSQQLVQVVSYGRLLWVLIVLKDICVS